MRIKDISPENRPRERFVRVGAESLSDAEVLAIILQKGTKEENVIDMANRLIAKYGIDKLSELSLNELQEINGIGPAKAMQIKALFELNKRIKGGTICEKVVNNSEDVAKYYMEKLRDKKKEYFIAVFLDSKNKIIRDEVISVGTLNSSLVHPREVFKSAIKESANAVILVHNHPSGNCSPSDEDELITEKLIEAGNIMQIKVLDHIVVAGDGYHSLMRNL